MEKDDKGLGSQMRQLGDEELDGIAGGELSEEKKAACWEKAKRLKIIMTADLFKEQSIFDQETTDYILSIWDEVEVPFTLYSD